MKRFLLSILFFVGVVSVGVGQTTYYAQVNGAWASNSTWNTERDGSGDSGIPGPTDNAYLDGYSVFITTNVEVGNIFFQFDTPNQISGTSLVRTLSINGKISSYEFIELFPGFFDQSPREVEEAVFQSMPNVTVEFTGSNGQNPEVEFWNKVAPIRKFRVNAEANNIIEIENLSLIGNSNEITSGTLNVLSGYSLSDNTGNSILEIGVEGEILVNGAINGDGTNTTKFNDVIINGSATTGTSGYINSNNFTLGDGATLNVNFNGSGQEEGWWYGSGLNAAPSVFTLSENSTINFTANSSQNFFAISTNGGYGNLNLNADSEADKTLVGSGNLFIKGNLNIQSGSVTFASTNTNPITIEGDITNDGIWETAQRVNFRGDKDQNINGSNPITFGAEVRINKPAGIVTLDLVDQIINDDLRIVNGTLRPLARNITISGNIINDGTIEATNNGIGGFTFNGTTEISGTGTTQFRNVTINDGASLSQEAGSEIEVTTNFTNNGTFVHNEGLVRFRQSGNKVIGGSATTSFYDLASEGGNLSINGNVDLVNVMSFVGNPTVDFDGTGSGVFTLKSTPTRDAAIGDIGTASVSGNITAERYIDRRDPTLDRGYHIVGFPATGVTIADVQQELPINGTFMDASGYTGDGSINPNNPSLYRYNESLGGALGDRYSAYPTTNNTATFTNGEGYSLFTFTGLAPVTIDGRGTIKAGSFSRSLSYTGTTDSEAGWHTIANPYPAPTDWSTWGKTNINGNAAHIYDPQTGNYIVYDGVSAGQLIPQGQGFWVKTTATGASVSAGEGSKVTGSTPTFYRTSDSPLERFEIILRKDTIDDIAIVSFNENASDNYEAAYDADRLLNVNETFSTLTNDGKPVKVNRLASFSNTESCSRSIFFRLEQMVNGNDYQLLFKDLDHLPTQNFILVDHYLNESTPVDNSTVYDFQVNSEAASKDDARFELVFSKNQPNQVSTVAEDICPSQNAMLTIENTQSFVNYLVLKNDEVVSSVQGSGSNLNIEIANDLLEGEINEFVLKGYVTGCDTLTVGNAQIQVIETLTYDNEVSGSFICKIENQAPYSVSTQAGVTYHILSNQDTIQSFEGNGSVYEGFLATENFTDGSNEFVVAAQKDDCESGTLNQTLAFGFYEDAVIDAVENQSICLNETTTIGLSANIEMSSYQLYVGDELVTENTAPTFDLSPKETTTYTLTGVPQNGCEVNEINFTIEVNDLAKPGILVSSNILESSVEGNSYQWYLDGVILESETGKVLIANQSGDYTVEVTKANCSKISDGFTFNEEVLSANKALQNALNIYPNPVEDNMFIELNDINSVNVTIFTLSGKFIDSFELNSSQSEIDMSKFSKGTYLIQFESGEGSVTKRIIKQ